MISSICTHDKLFARARRYNCRLFPLLSANLEKDTKYKLRCFSPSDLIFEQKSYKCGMRPFYLITAARDC